jgi:hypothetical protein
MTTPNEPATISNRSAISPQSARFELQTSHPVSESVAS